METVNIRLRVSREIKNDAEAIFKEMGLTTAEAVRIFLKQSINCGGLPFQPRVRRLNFETLQAFMEEKEGDYSESSLEEFKESLKIDKHENNKVSKK